MNQSVQILLVDNNRELRASLTRTLAEYRVIAVADGLSALQYLTRAGDLPSLIVADCQLPDLNGWDLTAAVRYDARTAHIPIILMSTEYATASLTRTAEAVAFLAKPFHIAVLRACLERCLHNGVASTQHLTTISDHSEPADMSRGTDSAS